MSNRFGNLTNTVSATVTATTKTWWKTDEMREKETIFLAFNWMPSLHSMNSLFFLSFFDGTPYSRYFKDPVTTSYVESNLFYFIFESGKNWQCNREEMNQLLTLPKVCQIPICTHRHTNDSTLTCALPCGGGTRKKRVHSWWKKVLIGRKRRNQKKERESLKQTKNR